MELAVTSTTPLRTPRVLHLQVHVCLCEKINCENFSSTVQISINKEHNSIKTLSLLLVFFWLSMNDCEWSSCFFTVRYANRSITEQNDSSKCACLLLVTDQINAGRGRSGWRVG